MVPYTRVCACADVLEIELDNSVIYPRIRTGSVMVLSSSYSNVTKDDVSAARTQAARQIRSIRKMTQEEARAFLREFGVEIQSSSHGHTKKKSMA